MFELLSATALGRASALTTEFSICNELFSSWRPEEVLKTVANLGYDGVEIAPFTLAEDVRNLDEGDRSSLRSLASANGIKIAGIHWMLASPKGLHLTHPEEPIRKRTREYIKELLRFTADIGGEVAVLGSPKQRRVQEGVTKKKAWSFMREALKECCEEAGKVGVTICLEPLSRNQTNFINTAREAVAMVNEVDDPHLQIVLDVYSMSDEGRPLDEIIREVGPHLRHFHANDTGGLAPGQGDADYRAVVRALRDIGYQGYVSVEVFNRSKDPLTLASESINTLRAYFGSI